MVMKKGDKYKCPDCGLVIVIEEECGCESCTLLCCDVPLKKVRAKAAAKPAKKAKKATVRKKRKQPKNFFMPSL